MGNKVILHRHLRPGAGAVERVHAGPSACRPRTPLSAAQAAAGALSAGGGPALESIRQHLRRYNELAGQGRWAEAGKEMDSIESEAFPAA